MDLRAYGLVDKRRIRPYVHMPLFLAAGWLILLAVFFRFWDLTSRVPPLMLWSLVFLAAYASTVKLRGEPARERGRFILWLALIVLAAAANLLIPTVNLGSARVRTVTFVKVLDTVVPVWILTRAMIVLWSGWARAAAVASIPAVSAVMLAVLVVRMPGESLAGELPALSAAESVLARELERDVRRLVPAAAERNHRNPEALEDAARYLDSVLTAAGYLMTSQPYRAGEYAFRNITATLPGLDTAAPALVIGAHYDAVEGAPGADDNASGTAALLALARALRDSRLPRTIRFVAFASEEPPFFDSDRMGSRHWARAAQERGERIAAMISLETVGYFSDEAGSQRYPPPFNLVYPDRGNFVGFVGNMASRRLVHRAIAAFREQGKLPSEGVAAPALVPGIGWSDHASFWLTGVPAIMITDTAPFRNPHYHLRSDTPDRLDYGRMARLVTGLRPVIERLATS